MQWCGVVCGLQETQHSLGWAAGDSNLIFYADDGGISGRYHKWVQDAFSVTVAMFRIMGLEKDMEKTKAMVCTP